MDPRRSILAGYLVTGALVLLVMAEGLAEALGVLAAPAEASLPGWLYTPLVFAMFAVGCLLVVGWPVAIAIIVARWRDRFLILPAVLFLGADLLLAVQVFGVPEGEPLLVPAGVLLGLYGVTAVAVAWKRTRWSTVEAGPSASAPDSVAPGPRLSSPS